MQDIYPRNFEVSPDTRSVPLKLESKKYPASALSCYLPNAKDDAAPEGFEIQRDEDGNFELHFDHSITKRTEIVVVLVGGTTSRHQINLTPAAAAVVEDPEPEPA